MQKEREEYNTNNLEGLYEITKENNILLKKIEKYQKINVILKVSYWVIILLSVFGAYFALLPFIGSLISEENGAINTISNQTQNLREVSKFKEIINRFVN
jgi:hypothetical protein